MRRLNHNFLFVFLLGVMLASMIFPPIFKWANRIEPWFVGIPFSTFWIISLCLLMSLTMMVWYYVDSKKGYTEINIEPATEEEMSSWKSEGDK